MSQFDSEILLAKASHFFSELMPLRFQYRIFQVLLLSIGNQKELITFEGDKECSLLEFSKVDKAKGERLTAGSYVGSKIADPHIGKGSVIITSKGQPIHIWGHNKIIYEAYHWETM
jgi:hypothetical protein